MVTQFKPKHLLAVLWLACTPLIAQSSNWSIYSETNSYKIEVSEDVACNYGDILSNSTYVFLKITNKTNAPITLSYNMEIYYQGQGCVTCNNDEYTYTITIPAFGSIAADCDYTVKGLSKLAIFKKYNDKPNRRIFERFELTNLILQ